MPRVKNNNPTRHTPESMSDDAPVSVVTEETVGDVATIPPVADTAEVAADGQVTAGTTETQKPEKKVGPKAARRAKTCEKCLARREREREYARAARLKSRALKDAKLAATSTPAPEGVDAHVDAAPASTA